MLFFSVSHLLEGKYKQILRIHPTHTCNCPFTDQESGGQGRQVGVVWTLRVILHLSASPATSTCTRVVQGADRRSQATLP